MDWFLKFSSHTILLELFILIHSSLICEPSPNDFSISITKNKINAKKKKLILVLQNFMTNQRGFQGIRLPTSPSMSKEFPTPTKIPAKTKRSLSIIHQDCFEKIPFTKSASENIACSKV